VRHGGSGPDPRETPPRGLRTRDIYIPDLHIDSIKVKTRDFRWRMSQGTIVSAHRTLGRASWTPGL